VPIQGITPTIILVRVSMGVSFHNEASMVEVAGSFLHFSTDDPTRHSIPETESIQESRDDGIDMMSGWQRIREMNPNVSRDFSP
jgi:hypothetical protein